MNTNSFLRSAIVIGIFSILFTPLIVSNSYFFPFITGKAFFFRIVVEIIAALWIILALRDKKYLPRFSKLTMAVTIFAGVILISDLAGVNIHKSIWSNFERMEGWVTTAHLWIYFMVLSSMLTTKKIWERFFNSSIGVSLILVLYGFVQLAGKTEIHQGGVRLDATLGNAAYFAVYLLIHIFITAFMLYNSWQKKTLRYFYGIAMLLQLIILYYTGTRGSILGLLGGITVASIILIVARRKNKAIRNTGIGILAGLILLISGFQLIKESDFVKNSEVLSRLAAISLRDAAPRFAIWNMAFEGFKEKPILGWGQENFNYVFNKYYEPSMYAQEQWFDRAHNVFFDWLIAGGIIGLFSYLSLFVFMFWFIWKSGSKELDFYERVILTALLIAYFIHNLFVFDHLVSYIFFFTFLAYVHTKTNENIFPININLDKKVITRVALPIVVIVFIVFLYSVNIRPMSANRTLIQAMSNQPGGAEENLELFKRALAYNTVGTQEMREQLVSASLTVGSLDQVDDAVKQKFFEFTLNELNDWIKENPEDARAHLFTANFISRLGLYKDAQKHFKRAHELSPNKQTIRFELAANYINQNMYKEGFDLLKSTYELDESFTEAKFMYAVGAVYVGNKALSDQLLASLGNDSYMTDQRLINAYIKNSQYIEVVKIYRDRLTKNPKDTNIRKSLAAIYLALGNTEAAIAELRQVVNDDPSFKEIGEKYINDIRAGKGM